jgi:branched-chain amino acid transport system permease protein
MEQYLTLAILGLGAGAVYAALAVGIVLTYRGSGVINFAYGAMAMYIGYLYLGLVTAGRYFLPPLPNPLVVADLAAGLWGGHVDVPEIPTVIHLGSPLAPGVAMLVALVSAALLGLVVHVAIFRPLRYSPTLAKVVASVGLMVVLQSIVSIRFGSAIQSVPDILPTNPVSIPGGAVPANRFWLLGVVVLVALALWAAFRFTRFGLATRAAADSEKGATLLGYSPDRLAATNWILASVLAGLVGILVAPITQLDTTNYTIFVVPALGAALVGGFRSFGVATATALGIGMAQSMLLQAPADVHWLPEFGTREALPFLIIVVAIMARGGRLPTRGTIERGRLPRAPATSHYRLVAMVSVAVTAVALVWLPYAWRAATINSLVGMVIALSLVVLVGFVGQISLAQLAFAGIAGFGLGWIASDLSVPFPLAPLLAATGAALVGLVVGVPALRVRGVNLAVVTLALAYAVNELVFSNPDLTGGGAGVKVPPLSLLGIGFGPNDHFFLGDATTPNPGFGLFVLAITALLSLAVVNLRRSTTGRRMLAVRANERAAAGVGVNVATTKLLAFTVSAFIAGMGGCLIAYRFESVSASSFTTLGSITALALAYLGGITTVRGAAIAGILSLGGLVPYALASAAGSDDVITLLSGLGLLVVAIAHPEGLAGTTTRLFTRLRGSPREPPDTDGAARPAPGTVEQPSPTSTSSSPGVTAVLAPFDARRDP